MIEFRSCSAPRRLPSSTAATRAKSVSARRGESPLCSHPSGRARRLAERRSESLGCAVASHRVRSATQADGKLDGKLELGEIYALNLAGCELTVLSACNTNLDPRQSARIRSLRGEQAAGMAPPALDTGFSIANAFLAAGSRRVVGTQRTVADDSTADLVARLFEKLHTQLTAGREVNYARLLDEARRDSRHSNPKWDTPFHWGPFVLIGPAESLPQTHKHACPSPHAHNVTAQLNQYAMAGGIR